MDKVYKLDEVIQNTGTREIDGKTPHQLVIGGKGYLEEVILNVSYNNYRRVAYCLLDSADSSWCVWVTPQAYRVMATLRYAPWSTSLPIPQRPDWRELLASTRPLVETTDAMLADLISEFGRLMRVGDLQSYLELQSAWERSWYTRKTDWGWTNVSLLGGLSHAGYKFVMGRNRDARVTAADAIRDVHGAQRWLRQVAIFESTLVAEKASV